MMILTLDNDKIVKIGSSEVVIMPTVPDAEFNIGDANTWESDRAWCACKPGTRIWQGKDGIRTIVSVH